MALTSLLPKITSIIEDSSTTTRGRPGFVAVVGVAAWLQLQQPVNGGSVVAGQLRQPPGGPAGGRDQHHSGVLAVASSTMERTVKLFPQPGPRRSAAFCGGSCRLCCPGAGPARQACSHRGALPQSTAARMPAAAPAGFSRASSPVASDCSARWKATR
jgi:hypothetical protein